MEYHRRAVEQPSVLTRSTPNRDLAAICVLENHVYLFGGRDALGAASHLLFTCPWHRKGQGEVTWQLVDCENNPMPRWGHSMHEWGKQLWVIGGENSSVEGMTDMHRLDPSSRVWREVPQRGDIPDRCFGESPLESFHHVVAYKSRLLAFGLAQQSRSSHINDPLVALHAFDFCSGEWSLVRTSGSLSIDNLLGLVVHCEKLHAIGWETKSPDEGVQVRCLRLVEHGLHWETVNAQGCIPTARKDCQVTLLSCESKIVLHGGVTTTEGVTSVSEDVFVFCLASATWEKLNFCRQHPHSKRDSHERTRHQHCAARIPHSSSILYAGGSKQLTPNAGCITTEIVHFPPRHSVIPTSNPAHYRRCSTGPHNSQRFKKFCCVETMSDVTLLAGGTPFPAHRVILATASPKFYELIESAAQSGREQIPWKRVVEVNDLSAGVMECVIKHIYGCLPYVPHHLAAELFSASDRYGLQHLRAECLSVLLGAVAVENIASCALLANEHKCKEMMEVGLVVEYAKVRTLLLSANQLDISEGNLNFVYQACISLASKNSAALASVLGSPGYLKLNRVCPELGQKFTQTATDRLLQRLEASSNVGQGCPESPLPYVGREVVLPTRDEKKRAGLMVTDT